MTQLDTDRTAAAFEVASPATVTYAAQLFAAALVDTSQYQAFEHASAALQRDATAQQAMADYRHMVESLRPMMLLNAVDIAQQDELDRLHREFASLPTVVAAREAQEALTSLCQLTAGLLSQHIGLDFAAACRASCCS